MFTETGPGGPGLIRATRSAATGNRAHSHTGNGTGQHGHMPGGREMGPMGPPGAPEGREMGPMGAPKGPTGMGLEGVIIIAGG